MVNYPQDGIDATDDDELSDETLKDLSGGAVVGITIVP
jgi:hypothetical protein